MNRDAPDRTTRIIIAEDHTLMAAGLSKLLEDQFEFVTVVGNGRELLDTVAVLKPHVALVDIAMPLLNGIEATRLLSKISPATKVVIFTAHTDPQYVVEAFRAGASAFVLKRCAVSELVIAIRCVSQGQTYVTPLIADRAGEAARESTPGLALTSRQREVLHLVAEGCTAKEIANVLEPFGQNGSLPQNVDHGQAGIAQHSRTDAVCAGARDRQDSLQPSGKGRILPASLSRVAVSFNAVLRGRFTAMHCTAWFAAHPISRRGRAVGVLLRHGPVTDHPEYCVPVTHHVHRFVNVFFRSEG